MALMPQSREEFVAAQLASMEGRAPKTAEYLLNIAFNAGTVFGMAAASKKRSKPALAAPAPVGVPGLPDWWNQFIENVCEIPDRNSPEDEPEAMIATAEELETCALRAIESLFIAPN